MIELFSLQVQLFFGIGVAVEVIKGRSRLGEGRYVVVISCLREEHVIYRHVGLSLRLSRVS